MADRNSRMGLIVVAGVVALGAAALALVFLWWMPRQDRAEARDQVAAWEQRWRQTRACLLGEPALSADPGEALALRELSSGVVHADTSCTEGVQHLMRGESAASPIESVEDRWRGVEAAIPALGEAYVMWISSEHDERDAWLDKLGVAISSLDAAQDELRKAAGMAALERKGSVTVTRLDAPSPIVVDGRALHAGAVIRAGAIVETQFDDAASVEVLVTGPGQGRLLPTPTGTVAALPDGSWTAAADPTGALTAGGVVVAPPGAALIPIAAFGAGAERSLLLDHTSLAASPSGYPAAFARSTDGGATWTIATDVAPIGDLGELALDPIAGVADLVVLGYDGTTQLLHVDAAHPLDLHAVVVPEAAPRERSCRRGASRWWKTEADVVLLDGAAISTVEAPDGDRVIDCTAAAALVEGDGLPVVYTRCDRTHCEEALRGSAYSFGRAAMLDDGRVVYVAARGRIVAKWTEGAPEATYYKLPAPLLLGGVVAWGGVPYAVMQDPEDASGALLSVPLR